MTIERAWLYVHPRHADQMRELVFAWHLSGIAGDPLALLRAVRACDECVTVPSAIVLCRGHGVLARAS